MKNSPKPFLDYEDPVVRTVRRRKSGHLSPLAKKQRLISPIIIKPFAFKKFIKLPIIILLISICLLISWNFYQYSFSSVSDQTRRLQTYSLIQHDKAIQQLVKRIRFPRQVIDQIHQVFRLPEYHIGNMVDYRFLEKVSEFFDVRLASALSLGLIKQRLKQVNKFDRNYKTSFSWSSWLDLDNRLSNEPTIFSCESFKEVFDVDFHIPCINVENGGIPSYYITGPVEADLPTNARRLLAASYLSKYSPIPKRLMFLEAGPNNESLLVPTKKCIGGMKCLFDMAVNYISHETDNCKTTNCKDFLIKGISFKEQLNSLYSILKSFKNALSFHSIFDELKLIDLEPTPLVLNEKNFEVDKTDLQNKALKQFNKNKLRKIHNSNKDFEYQFLQHASNLNPINPPKFFHEANLKSKNHNGAHYDWRFFSRAIYDDSERNLILHRLTKAWLTFIEKAGINSWLMHGSLLGYYFNGMNMPFDGDLDVSVTTDSLVKLAKYFNHTLVIDTSLNHNDEEALGTGAYLIDVNPTYLERTKGNGKNTIDARFIDIYSGLYIDITAISNTVNHQFNKKSLTNFQNEFNQMLDPDYMNKIEISTLNMASYQQLMDDKLYNLIENKEIFNCKNNHFYQLSDISPLKEVYFEGLKAKIPNDIEKILKREYNKALYKFKYKNYMFRSKLRLWVSQEDCSFNLNDKECLLKNAKIKNDFKITNLFTKFHEDFRRKRFSFPNNEIPLPIKKSDPWLINFAETIYNIN